MRAIVDTCISHDFEAGQVRHAAEQILVNRPPRAGLGPPASIPRAVGSYRKDRLRDLRTDTTASSWSLFGRRPKLTRRRCLQELLDSEEQCESESTSIMARINQPGFSLQLPNEREVSLSNVLADLGLRPLEEEELRDLRLEIGLALSRWCEPKGGVDSLDVARRLRRHASQLDKMKGLLAAADLGWHRDEDIQAAMFLVSALQRHPAISGIEAAQAHMGRFREMAADFAVALRVAADYAKSIKGGNTKDSHWYDGFLLAVAKICERNGIPVKKVSSRKFDEPSGRFFEVVAAFERILLPKMRSRTPAALAKRINRSLDRLGSGALPRAPT